MSATITLVVFKTVSKGVLNWTLEHLLCTLVKQKAEIYTVPTVESLTAVKDLCFLFMF